jgi:hypothetical protein
MRKNEIAYLRQRGADLEALVFALCDQLVDHGLDPVWPIMLKIEGDVVLTDVNTGLFDFDLANHIATYKKDKA